MENLTTKQRATLLLREYDEMRARLRIVERELAKAAAEYGRETGHWGFNKDHLRIQLQNEENARIEAQADQSVWERSNG